MQKFTPEGDFITSIERTNNEELKNPQKIAIDKNGRIYILSDRQSIKVFNKAGLFLFSWEVLKKGNDQYAIDIGSSDSGIIYVLAYELDNLPNRMPEWHSRIMSFYENGTFIDEWVFNEQSTLSSLALDQDGNILTSSIEPARIYIITNNGTRIGSFDIEYSECTRYISMLWWGREDGRVRCQPKTVHKGPADIAVYSEGYIFLSHSQKEAVLLYDRFGNSIYAWYVGDNNTRGGNVYESFIDVDSKGNIYLLNEKNIKKYVLKGDVNFSPLFHFIFFFIAFSPIFFTSMKRRL